MKEFLENILSEIDVEIDEIDLYGYDIVENSLSMVHRLQAVLNDLKQNCKLILFQPKRMKLHSSKHRNRKFLADCYSSIRFIG